MNLHKSSKLSTFPFNSESRYRRRSVPEKPLPPVGVIVYVLCTADVKLAGAAFTRFTVTSVGVVPTAAKVIRLFKLPKVNAVAVGKGAPERRAFPTTSKAPADTGAVPGCVRMFEPVVRSLFSVNVPLTVAFWPRVTPDPVFAMVKWLNAVAEEPAIDCPPDPLNTTVLELAVNAPLLVQFPLTLIVLAAVAVSVAVASI